MDLLSHHGDLKFFVDTGFDIKYLAPVQKYVQWKLENNQWDDYNELFHASRLIESLKAAPNVWFDTHLLYKNDVLIGVLFIVGGKIAGLEKTFNIENESRSLLLKYFHIQEKGNGYGSLWLTSAIIPHYREKGFKQIYVNSSHKESFPFYSRLGEKIAEYKQQSDNSKSTRIGNSFCIPLVAGSGFAI